MPPRCAREALRSSRERRGGGRGRIGEMATPDVVHLLPAIHDVAEELGRALGVVDRGVCLAAVPTLPRGFHGTAEDRLPEREAAERHRVETAERMKRAFLVLRA